MMRVIPYVVYLLLIACYRTLLAGVLSIGQAHIDLAALIVLLLALNKEEKETVWFALAAGLIYDAPDPSRLGVHALIFTVMAVMALQARERLNLDSIQSRLILVLAGLVFYSIPYTLIYPTSGSSEFFRSLWSAALPSIVYSAILAWIFFMAQSGRLSFARIRSIF
jgi:rod shape-determining protein MreD